MEWSNSIDDESLFLISVASFYLRDRPKLEKLNICFNLDDLSDDFCWIHFRFYRKDIYRLLDAFGLPDKIVTDNGQKVPKAEAFCVMLDRISYPKRYWDQMKYFPRTQCELSRIFNATVKWIINNHLKLLTEPNPVLFNLENLKSYAAAIKNNGSPYDHCIGFLDGTLRPICRPEVNQKEFYNGHKRVHGLKFQSLMLPNGIIGLMFGPTPGRRHDAFLLEASGWVQILDSLDRDSSGQQFYLYADPAYPLLPCIIPPFKGNHLTTKERKCNKRMSSVRECVEWGFGKIVEIFAFLDFKKNLKIGLQDVSNYYLVGTILINCHTCIYGSQTSSFFDCNPPSLENYIKRSNI